MAQNTLVMQKRYCHLCNGYYNNDVFNYHISTKYHKYATNEEDLEYKGGSKLIPIIGTKMYCTECSTCTDNKENHECEEPSVQNYESEIAIDSLAGKYEVTYRPVCRAFKYHGIRYCVCLLCSTIDVGLAENHMHSDMHKESTFDYDRQVRLDQFYLFFINTPREVVERFMPLSLDRIQCLKCMQIIPYRTVQMHNNCSYNSFIVTDSCLRLPINKLYDWNNKLDYDERILNMFYPKKLMKIVYKFDKTPIYVAQKASGSLKCLFCCVEGIIGIEQVVEHFTSFRHLMNSNNVLYNQALSTYHQYFALSDVGDQMRHHLFEPLSSNGVTCLLCQNPVVFKEIKNHNCPQEAAESTSSEDSQIADVAELLKMNAMIMDYSPKQKLCLCCETILNNEKNVVEHVMSKKHKNAAVCKKDIVQVYLDFWGSEKRKEQKYYLPYDLNKFRCMECRHSVNLSAIVPHAAECIPTLSEAEPTMYKDSVKKALYPTSKTFKECVFQKRNKLLFCLYCCATLQGSTEDHCKVPSHLKNINNSNKVKMVEAYHNYWKHKSEEMQLSQICFSPSNSRTVECNWCERFFTFQELKGHNCLNLKIGDFKLLTGELAYCSEVMETVYPHDNFEVQVSNKKYLCLFCNVDATGTLDWHLAGKSHRKKIRNKERVQAVVRYHRFWMSKGNDLQLNQLKYRPFNHQCMECVQCNLVHGWDVLMKHKCDVPSQTVKKMRYGADIMRTVYHHMTMCDAMDTFVVQRIDANLYNCLHCRMTFSESVSEHCKSVRHKAKAKLNLWMSALNAYHSYWLNSKTPMDQIHYTTHSHVNMRCLRCEDVVFFNDVLSHKCSPMKSPKTQNKTVYCYEVLFSIYSHLESERMEDLFIQKIDDKTYHCLHCAIQIRRNWDKHAKTHAHSGRIDSNDEFISKSVSRYHKFWVSGSSPAVQLMQTKYFPYDMENGTCVWCDSILPYNETMIKHKCVESSDSSGSNSSDDEDEEDAEVLTMLERKDEVLLQRYKGPSKLHNLVRSVLYPHNLCQLVSNSHLKLHFPIFHNRIMKIRCLLCTKDIDKTEKDVINHLKNYHGQFTSRLFTQAIHVIAYHKHFEKQPIDKHYLQSYFMPAGTRTANCLRLHNVEYSKLEHHYVKCAKRSDKTLEGSMKKFTNPNLIQGAGKVFHEMVIVPKGRFPVRLQYQSEFFRMEAEPSKKVYCKYCEIDLESFSDALLHLAEEKHSVLLKSKEKYMYVCDMCCYKTHREIDWQKHFSSTGHQNMYKSIGEIRQTTLHEFECKICAYVLYGDELSVFDHKEGLAALKPNKKIKNREQSDKKLRKIFGNEESTEVFLEERQVECELVGSPAVQLCLQDIKEQLQTKYPHCKVFPFGSRAIEIGDSNSDLDVFADLKSNYFGGAGSQQQSIIREMTKLLKLRSDLFQLVFSIPTARTPIIRFMHASTEINCDLSFMNGLSVENTKFVKFCYDLQPISRDAVLLLRCFSNIESLYGEYKICSYAFSMMLLFYMQTKGWLLSVQRLRSLTNTDVQVIDGWPIIDYNESVETLKQNVEEYTGGGVYQLVKGFFEFYNEFNFEKDVVCPFMGAIVKRKQFNGEGVNLPSEMSVYRKNLKEGESFRVDDCYMCVQDPFDLSHNLTKAVSSDAVASFKFKCRNVLQMFSH